MKELNFAINESKLSSVYEYIIKTQINKDLEFLFENEINEGKFTKALKKFWNWLTGDSKKNEVNSISIPTIGSDVKDGKVNTKCETDHKGIYIRNCDIDDVKEIIYKNNKLSTSEKYIIKGQESKCHCLLLVDDYEKPVGILIYTYDLTLLPEYQNYSKAVLILGIKYDKSVISNDDSALKELIMSSAALGKKKNILVIPSAFCPHDNPEEPREIFKKMNFTEIKTSSGIAGQRTAE